MAAQMAVAPSAAKPVEAALETGADQKVAVEKAADCQAAERRAAEAVAAEEEEAMAGAETAGWGAVAETAARRKTAGRRS